MAKTRSVVLGSVLADRPPSRALCRDITAAPSCRLRGSRSLLSSVAPFCSASSTWAGATRCHGVCKLAWSRNYGPRTAHAAPALRARHPPTLALAAFSTELLNEKAPGTLHPMLRLAALLLLSLAAGSFAASAQAPLQAQNRVKALPAASQTASGPTASLTASRTWENPPATTTSASGSPLATRAGAQISEAALSKGAKFFKGFAKRSPFDQTTRQVGKFTEFGVSVPGRVRGSYTRWVKTVDPSGRTVRLYHDTFDKTGKFIHRGVKVPGPERHVP